MRATCWRKPRIRKPDSPLLRLFSREANRPGSVFLDASAPGGDLGRFSLMGTRPFLVIEGKENRVAITDAKGTRVFEGDPLAELSSLLDQHREYTQGFFGPGAIGYLSYELGYRLHGLKNLCEDDLGVPDLWFAFYDRLTVLDHHDGTLLVTSLREPRTAIPEKFFLTGTGKAKPYPVSSFTREGYDAAFWKVMRHIAAGNVYQVNLCRRFSVPFLADPWDTYGEIRNAHPTPLSAFLNTGSRFILSASPELFLKKQGDRIETRPIKGTQAKPISPDPIANRRARQRLERSEKDRAEHIMIVDMERNDLGQICVTGSVSAADRLRIEACGTVYHLVSTVEGSVRPDVRLSEILKGTFPGGSITGAPKRSAMKIIQEIEPCVRGVYTGALGWIGFSGDFALNLPIRTVLLQDGYAHFHVGGGIVADSTPEGEYQETLDKGSAFFRILGAPHDHAASI